MPKIQLDLDHLRVSSFPTTPDAERARGTVRGAENPPTGAPTCLGYLTCGGACSATDGVRVCKTCGPACQS